MIYGDASGYPDMGWARRSGSVLGCGTAGCSCIRTPTPTSLHVLLAEPDDPDLDRLDSGNAEIDRYVKSRAWFNASRGKSSPPTYKFNVELDGAVLGYASVARRKVAHPDDHAALRAPYLTIYAVGLHSRFHGVRDPGRPEQTYAASIFDFIEELAREETDIAGLSLWVRMDNIRAIHFYEKMGFEPDPGGPVQRDSGPPHLSMRKLF